VVAAWPRVRPTIQALVVASLDNELLLVEGLTGECYCRITLIVAHMHFLCLPFQRVWAGRSAMHVLRPAGALLSRARLNASVHQDGDQYWPTEVAVDEAGLRCFVAQYDVSA
jgi:hypothetical protein